MVFEYLIIVNMFIVSMGVSSSDHDCSDSEGEPAKMMFAFHTEKNSDIRRCCMNIKCPAGTESGICKENLPNSTSCIPCKSGMFNSFESYSSENLRCELHTQCGEGSRIKENGSSSKNVECVCNLDLGYSGNYPTCWVGNVCPGGQQLKLNGSCEECPLGSYKDNENNMPCKLCNMCNLETQEVISNCTATCDTVCRNSTGNVDMSFLLIIYIGASISALIMLVIIIATCMRKIWKNKESSGIISRTNSSLNTSNGSASDVVCAETHQLLLSKSDIDSLVREQPMLPGAEAIIKLQFCTLCHPTDYQPQDHYPLPEDSTFSSETVSSVVNLRDERDSSEMDSYTCDSSPTVDDSESYQVETERGNISQTFAQKHEPTVLMKGNSNVYGNTIVIHNYHNDHVQT